MKVGELRKKIQGLPDDMEIIGEFSGTGQKDVFDIRVCYWEQGGFCFARGEAEIFGEIRAHGKAERLEKPVLKIIIDY